MFVLLAIFFSFTACLGIFGGTTTTIASSATGIIFAIMFVGEQITEALRR